MIVYKGFHKNLTCTMGNGTYKYTPGELNVEESSKCRSTGFHACEYPLGVFRWYSNIKESKYYKCEAGGSIDEVQNSTDLACSELTLLEELSLEQITYYALMWIATHPKSPDWECLYSDVMASVDNASTSRGIAIARGQEPHAKGEEFGACLGFVEERDGEIQAVRMIKVDNEKYMPKIWYACRGGEIVRCCK